MNIYVVVEGDVTEKIVYQHWIPYVNPQLTLVNHPTEVTENSFVIIGGQGYPQYRERIERAANDVERLPTFDRLVVAVDSEERDFANKQAEIRKIIEDSGLTKDFRIIIQHFCFEAWALGNRRVPRRNPRDDTLRRYKTTYDVFENDPELLPGYEPEELTRVRFALKYLKAILRDRSPSLRYSKSDPGSVKERRYFDALVDRQLESGHIPSFQQFLTAFV